MSCSAARIARDLRFPKSLKKIRFNDTTATKVGLRLSQFIGCPQIYADKAQMKIQFRGVLLSVVYTVATASFLAWAANVSQAEVTAEKNDHGVVIKIDGQPFTEYLTNAGHSPALYPIIGPTGKPVTRAYPFAAKAEGGTDDHPHHQSLWFSHGIVNDIDFWTANRKDDKGNSGPHVVQRELVKVAGGETATIVTRNDWMNGDERVCEDERTLEFGAGPNGSRWIDFAITIKATDGDVTFGDTKEGAFAIRVADSMRVESKKGGRIENSEGLVDGAAWGKPARWVDYTGPVDGETVGITAMSHPKSFRPTPSWHVRTYGLFAANPFGKKDFPNPDAAAQGPVTIKKGESVTFSYRVWLHRGETDKAAIEKVFDEFAKQ